jgi:hypothetical protein
MTDFRALCEELVDALKDENTYTIRIELIDRARAALAEQPVGPTDEDLYDLAEVFNGEPVAAMRHALELWGTPAIQPVPVSERLPGPEDWDSEGRCWMFDPCDRGWWAYRPALPSDGEIGRPPWTHWLPHWTLPVPTPVNTNQEGA